MAIHTMGLGSNFVSNRKTMLQYVRDRPKERPLYQGSETTQLPTTQYKIQLLAPIYIKHNISSFLHPLSNTLARQTGLRAKYGNQWKIIAYDKMFKGHDKQLC